MSTHIPFPSTCTRMHDFSRPCKVALTTALLIEVAILTIGILALSQTLPAVGTAPALALTGAGGGLLVLTVALACGSRCTTKQKHSSSVAHTNLPEIPPQQAPQAHPPVQKNFGKKPLPTSFYQCSGSGEITTLSQWHSATLNDKGIPTPTKPADCVQFDPIAASPQHGEINFVIDGAVRQYIVLSLPSGLTISMDFCKERSATFMKPNIDTTLVCSGLCFLFKQGLTFKQAADVGAGSGFIAKAMALHQPNSSVTAIDIDPEAIKYMNSEGAQMPPNVTPLQGDAMEHLSQNTTYDLIVCNPPYVPTQKETQSEDAPKADDNFWEGTAMICHLLEKTLFNLPVGGSLVMVLPSTALKAKRVSKLLQELPPTIQATVVTIKEIAYKAMYAGNNKVAHLLATDQEQTTPTHFAGANLDLFVGITNTTNPRFEKINDGRTGSQWYHWQVFYLIQFKNKA